MYRTFLVVLLNAVCLERQFLFLTEGLNNELQNLYDNQSIRIT